MSTLSLRRHHRQALDHVLHRAHQAWAEPAARAAFVDLLAVVRARSDLLAVAPTVLAVRPCFEPVDALVHLARWCREHRAPAATWPGRRGHPLVVIDELARHLFGLYPTPRFLAQAWFASDRADADTWRGCVIALGRGTSPRRLSLPIALTRAMARHFLATEDHVPLSRALRQAEVLGLGGTPALARAIAATRLGDDLGHGPYWRLALGWIARRADQLPAAELGPILDYLEAARATSPVPPVAGRSVASLMRQVRAWHAALGRVTGAGPSWAATGWDGRDEVAPAGGDAQVWWHLVELRDAGALAAEGQALRHCVYSYRYECRWGHASIWSLRRRVERPGDLGRARSVATIEVDPRTRTIVQLRGFANRRAPGPGVDVVRRWAAGLRLAWSPAALASLAA